MAGGSEAPSKTDLLIAGGCGSLAMAGLVLASGLASVEPEVAGGAPEVGSVRWWAVMAALAAQAALLVWRRSHAGAVAGTVAVTVVVCAAVGAGTVIGLTSFAVVVAVWSLATRQDAARVIASDAGGVAAGRAPLTALVAVVVAAGHVVAGLETGVGVAEAVLTGVAQAAVLVGVPVSIAALVVARRESRFAQEDRLRALEGEYAARVDAAVARERTAMARELHDIAAHHLTGIAVMSAAIVTQIDRDPAGAKQAMGEVRHQSTEVLRDLRSLVGLLRDQDTRGAGSIHGAGQGAGDHAGGAAWVNRVETLAGIPRLIADVIAAGQNVHFTVLEATNRQPLGAGVGPLAQLAAYRTVQESLANAGRHAPNARCLVEVDDRDPDELVVTISNAAAGRVPDPGTRGGLGLVGMRERAELTASHLDVGPDPDGGWVVRLRTPRADTVFQ